MVLTHWGEASLLECVSTKIIKKNTMKTISTKKLLSALLVLSICVFAFACQKNGSSSNTGKSSLNVYLTDDPSLVFDHVFLDIQKVEIKVEDDSEIRHESEQHDGSDDNDRHGDTDGGWTPVPIHPGIYDILRFRNGLDTLFGSISFDANRELKKVRITLGNSNSIEFNGISLPLILNGNDNFIVINIDESVVNIRSGGLTNFWIDIDAGRSINRHGNDFELKPSVKVFSREKSGGIEGRVFPASARAVVMVTNGTDTATAKPEDSGEFKFIGLKPGTYSVIFNATANNYIDTTINNIILHGQEDVQVANVTLHQ
jgi:hypothetical protein